MQRLFLRMAKGGALALIALVVWSGAATAAPKYARTSGNWGTNGNWSSVSCAAAGATTFPTAADDVTICNGVTITVDAAGRAANSVTIATGATATGLTFAAGSSLNVTNDLLIDMPTGNVTKQVNVATGTLTVGGNVTLTGGSTANRDALLTVSSGLVTINGGLTINATVATSSTVSITAAGGRITVNGAAGVTNRDVLSIGAGTFSMTNAAATLTTSDAAIVSATTVTTGTLTVAGNAVVSSGAVGASTMTVTTGTIAIGGNLSVTAAQTGTSNTGDATVSVSTGRIDVTGTVTVTGGAVAGQVATLGVTGASAAGQGINIGGALNIVSGVVGTATVNANVAGARITVNGAGGVSNEDTLNIGAGTFSMTNAAGTLTTSDAAIVSATTVTTGTLTVAGNAVVDSGAVGASSMTVTSGVITIGGNLGVTAAAATNDNGDATVSVTTGRIDVGGNVTVTGGSNNARDALLTVTGASAAGQGINIGGALNIVSSVATSSTVSITAAGGRITVNGAAGVTNRDVLSIGAGTFSMTNAAATLTTSDAAIVSTTTVTTGTLSIAGNAVVDSGAVGASSMTVTSGVITIGGNLGVTAAAATNNNGDATVSVTTGRIDVAGNVTVTGGNTNARDALLTVTGAGAAGQGINIGGSLNIVSSVAGSATVSTTNATSRITVNGAGGVNNEDTLSVGPGIVSLTNAAATLTTSDAAIVSATTVTTGTLSIAGNAVVDSGAVGASSMTVTSGVITIGGNLGVTAAAATNNNGDATVSVTTGRIDVAGNVTVTGGNNNQRDALLTVTGAGAAGQGINIGGSLNIVSSVAGSATVSTTNATSRITVNGAGGVNNEDTLSVGPGIVSLTDAAATLTNSDPTIAATITISTGTLSLAGSLSNAAGESLVCSAACNILVGGTFSSSGTFTPSNGTATFNGSAAQIISGTNPVAFRNFTITNAANPNITLATNVTVSGTLTGTVSLTNTCPIDYTFTAGALVLHSCPPAPSGFNAFETPSGSTCATMPVTTNSGPIWTKIVGTGYSLCVVGLNSALPPQIMTTFSGTIRVELLGRDTIGALDANGCPRTNPGDPTVTNLYNNAAVAMAGGRATVAFTAPTGAWRDVRVRISYPTASPTLTRCSTDNFAIRPTSLSVSSSADADATGADVNATPVVKAGGNFTLTATALPSYNGTPSIDPGKVGAHAGAAQTGTVGGSFDAADPLTGVASGTAFTYSEVGYFSFATNGVYDDTFTVVDQPNDCTDDFSNTLSGGKYGCKFGNTATTDYFGRFIPDHFGLATLASNSLIDRADINTGTSETCPTCCPSSFTYMGEDFKTRFELSARNAADVVTKNYTGGHAKFDLTNWSGYAFTGSDGTLAVGSAAPGGVWGSTAGTYGIATVTATHAVQRSTTTPAGPYTSFTVSAQPSYTDGSETVALASSTQVHAGNTEIRYGRMRLQNALGSELRALPVPVWAEYWNGTVFTRNTQDSCTPNGAVTLSGTAPCTLTPAVSGVGTALSSGAGTLRLAAPGVRGCADLTMSVPDWLKGRWSGTTYTQNPSARATFGVFRDRVLYRRENY